MKQNVIEHNIVYIKTDTLQFYKRSAEKKKKLAISLHIVQYVPHTYYSIKSKQFYGFVVLAN